MVAEVSSWIINSRGTVNTNARDLRFEAPERNFRPLNRILIKQSKTSFAGKIQKEASDGEVYSRASRGGHSKEDKHFAKDVSIPTSCLLVPFSNA